MVRALEMMANHEIAKADRCNSIQDAVRLELPCDWNRVEISARLIRCCDWNRNISRLQWLRRIINSLEDTMNNRLAMSSLIAASLLASSAAFAQSTTVQGANDGARAGGAVGGPVGEVVGGTVGAAVGLGLEIPNAVITSIQGDRVRRWWCASGVVVGEPLPPTVELRTVPSHTEYRYAVVNDRRVIVEPRTRKIIKIID